jgi:nucleoside transporter
MSASSANLSPLNRVLQVRLAAMMFLQYAIWGVWSPVLGLYLKSPGPMGFSATQTGLIYMTWALGSIVAPPLAGQIADRWFPAQGLLALVHGLGALLMFLLAQVQPGDFWGFLGLMGLYQLLCAPTMGLTSALAFHHLPDGARQFGGIRLWGTLGWIAIGLLFGEWLKDWATVRTMLGQTVAPAAPDLARVGQCLNWAGVLSLVMAGYCLALPHTPPTRQARNPFAFLSALRLLHDRSFAFFFLVAVLVATEMQFYFVFGANFFVSLGIDKGTAAQLLTLGQIVEVVTLLALPVFVTRFGFKTTLLLGILAWSVRYGIFALGAPLWLVVASQGLHGLAYGFFFVGGQLYIDRQASKDIRASAQSLMVLAVLGVGKLISSLIAGPVVDHFTTFADGTRETQWGLVFLVPTMVTLLGALVFLYGFRERTEEFREPGTDSSQMAPEAARTT